MGRPKSSSSTAIDGRIGGGCDWAAVCSGGDLLCADGAAGVPFVETVRFSRLLPRFLESVSAGAGVSVGFEFDEVCDEGCEDGGSLALVLVGPASGSVSAPAMFPHIEAIKAAGAEGA